MPKYGKFFDNRLEFSCSTELRQKLIALSYLQGDAGSYSRITRVILARAVDNFIAELDPQESRDFKKIMDSVRAKTLVSRMERDVRTREKVRREELRQPDPVESSV